MRTLLLSMFLVPALFLAACGGSGGDGIAEQQGAPLGQEYVVGYGETITVGGLSLEFIRLDEETRCPINASCVAFWQGNARIHIKATRSHVSEVIALNTFAGYARSATFDGYEDDGILDFAAGCQHQRTTVVTRELLAILTELARTGPTEDELEKARRRNAWEIHTAFDSPEDVAGFYAGSLLFGRFQTPEARLAENAAVTRERIRALAELVAQPDRLNVVAVGLLERDEDKRFAEAVKGFKAP